jgi:hypothetical protein
MKILHAFNSFNFDVYLRTRMQIIVFLILSLGLLASCISNSDKNKSLKPEINYEFGGGAGHYDYAPSAIEDEYKIRYLFVCQNKNPFEIVDYIYLFKGIPTKKGYVWQPGIPIVAPSKEGWDKIHICDPDVRRFDMTYKGEKYKWIMTYLGVDQWHNHNQIGLAFSKNIEGPYVKYDLNPLISFSDTTKWGVGQSTSIVLDSTTVQLFYSKSEVSGSVMCVRNIKLNVLDSIDTGEERVVPFLYPNTYFSSSKKNMYAVSEIRINQSDEIPTWVGNHVRLVYKPLSESLFTEKDEWIELEIIGPEDTGFPRNHNPGFLTDAKGYMISDDEAMVYFTVAMTGENWLWSYDLYSARFDLR